jgi:hypothetical protein
MTDTVTPAELTALIGIRKRTINEVGTSSEQSAAKLENTTGKTATE